MLLVYIWLILWGHELCHRVGMGRWMKKFDKPRSWMSQSTFPLILFRAQQVSIFLGKPGCPREIQKIQKPNKKTTNTRWHSVFPRKPGAWLWEIEAFKTKTKRCQPVFLGKPGCLGETQPPRSLADHRYATAAADWADQNLIHSTRASSALSLWPERKIPKIDPKPSGAPRQQTLLAKNLWGWISRLHALNTLGGHSHNF